MHRALAMLIAVLAPLVAPLAAHASGITALPDRIPEPTRVAERSTKPDLQLDAAEASGHSLFLSRDPSGYKASINRYAALQHDPIDYRDPSGAFPKKPAQQIRAAAPEIKPSTALVLGGTAIAGFATEGLGAPGAYVALSSSFGLSGGIGMVGVGIAAKASGDEKSAADAFLPLAYASGIGPMVGGTVGLFGSRILGYENPERGMSIGVTWGAPIEGVTLLAYRAGTAIRSFASGGPESVANTLRGAGVTVGNYQPIRKIIGQETAATCVAAACRMIADDFGIAIAEEEEIAKALGTSEFGTNMLNASETLSRYGVSGASAVSNASIEQLEASLASGRSAMVSLNIPGIGRHAMVVDQISATDVLLRDPLPLFTGSGLSIPRADFVTLWTGRLVSF